MRSCLFFLSLFLISCVNDVSEVDALTGSDQAKYEKGSGITILYSDSASVNVRITADSLLRENVGQYPIDHFTHGIFVEFLNKNGRPSSWLVADHAVRDENSSLVTAYGNVRFYNNNNDKLISTELIWDEDKSILYTDKFVTIIQPEKGDTIYGFGFESNKDFNIFEIKRRTSAIFASQDLFKD